MGNRWGLGLHLIFVSIFLLATTCTCLGVGNISVVCSEEEQLALLKFKQSVQDDSKMLSSWVGNDCCLWERVRCDNDSGNVESLDLRGDKHAGEGYYYLGVGEVNSYLAELRHLKYLDLSGNDFGGSRIPKFIGSLMQLKYLNLSGAGFQGIIPHHIGNLSNLKVLDLSSNRGPMPDEPLVADDVAWTFGLSSLEHLDLTSVDLGRAQNRDMLLYMIPSLKFLSLSDCRLSSSDLGPFLNSSRILPNIKHLDLGLNSFEGPLPGFFQNLTSLAFLDLSGFESSSAWNFANLLNMIPSLSELHLSNCGLDKTFLSFAHLNFSTLSNIQHLNLRDNSIQGIFPSVLTNMSSLRVLDLTGNSLNSSVPIMPNLLELYLSENTFHRIEDVGIWRQCHLIHLSVAENANGMEMIDSSRNLSDCSEYALEGLDLEGSLINGTIPEALGRMVNLRFIYLSRNGLTGPIPKSLGRLIYLDVLYLSANELTGSIPPFLGILSVIDFSSNQLNGSIPESFGNLTALSVIDLSNNLLNGSIPESFGNLAALREFNLAKNQLTGPIPASLGRLVSLRTMMLSRNLLNGNVPVSVGQLTKLQSLDISYNFLEGVVYEAHFANLLMLKRLDASHNTKLTFNVSREWRPPFQLQTILLGSCNITNGFPQWLQNQRKIESLVLSNATITGPLPTWLQKMPIIPFLDLSHNKLIGPLTNIPSGGQNPLWRGLTSALLLQNNLFNGSIPRSLCTIDLQYLDLSKNRLTGKIPNCFENMEYLVTMRFSSNRLHGVIPSSIALNSLMRLRLNGNNFVGELPRELGNLRDLEVLDVGDNKLSGNIPVWIGENLTSLIVLRLHKNNFTGRIPRTLCNTSKLQILDVSYNDLTGTIPPCLGELPAMVNSDPEFLADPDHDENLIQVMKGVELEYSKNLALLFNMDLSSNKLVGEIPVKLTALSMLVGLNFSNNHLIGGIPDNIGHMMKLESLDLSGNELTGVIPPSMAALTFLSHLNLSHNNLSGRIPTGNQLQTLIDPSIYAENKDLCGPPLPKGCSNPENPTTTTSKKKYEAADEPMEIWFYVNIMSGFATGFWGVIGVLLFKKHWRQKLFMFAEETMDKIYVAVLVRVAKMKTGREAA